MVNKALKLAILEKFDSQADFSEAVGANEATISRVIRGRRKLKPEEFVEWQRTLACDDKIFKTVVSR